jgi:hypothetical protein
LIDSDDRDAILKGCLDPHAHSSLGLSTRFSTVCEGHMHALSTYIRICAHKTMQLS